MFKRTLKAGLSGVLSLILFLGITPERIAEAAPLPPFPSQGLHLASLLHFSGSRPDNLGVTSGKLAPCPSSPNCVSSQSSDLEHQTDPLPISENPNQAIQRLQEILETQDNAEIITAEPDYLYAEFTSNIMGFVDDVEFWADSDENVIQVRSASRLGESDLGVNRQRVESIRAKFAPELS
jgi:uncharacterized protein (DUF1499 family)